MRTELAILVLAVVLPVGSLQAPAAASEASTSPPATRQPIVWLGADKKPLPIRSEDELLDLLRTGREVDSELLSQGITRAKRLRLARNGLEVRVVFHHIDRNEQMAKRLPNGNIVMYLRDSYLSQIAAYEIGRLLGMTNIPPTARRRSGGQRGSVQLWIERAMTEDSRQKKGLQPPDQTLWNQLYADMRVFDNLINNIDRNQGNMLVDSEWNLWLIDHTRSFGRDKTLPYPEAVTRCSRQLWQALRLLDESEVRLRLSTLMSEAEIQALLARRQKLVALIEKRIADNGEEAVLFDYGDPEPGIKVKYDNGTSAALRDSHAAARPAR
jgi:hypothetical protein